MRVSKTSLAVVLAVACWAVPANRAQAQFGYPGGFGDFGWAGWGASTVEGDIARGLGVFAAGLGSYNVATAQADAINAETLLHWNEYVYQGQMVQNARFREQQMRAAKRTQDAQNAIQDRVRNNPESRDIFMGTALNVSLDEINHPSVYTRLLKGASTKIGSDKVRLIPFQYAAAGITMGIHQLATGRMPAPLLKPEFDAEREALKALDQQLLDQTADDNAPDPETVKKFLQTIYAAEEKAANLVTDRPLEKKQAQKYLLALHGLVAMLKAPALDQFLEGVDKRPEITLAQLLNFMSAFNLRFAPATTAQQRQLYTELYPMLVGLREQIGPLRGGMREIKTTGHEPEDFFSAMNPADLAKKAPRP